MVKDDGLQPIGDLFKRVVVKAPAYEWQDLALRIIKELSIPKAKRNAVFRVCKQKQKQYIEKCLNDTKELCVSGEQWRYFFKIVGGKNPTKIKI